MHVDNKGLIDDGEKKENASIPKLEMLTCGSKFRQSCTTQEISMEVEHVKADRTK